MFSGLGSRAKREKVQDKIRVQMSQVRIRVFYRFRCMKQYFMYYLFLTIARALFKDRLYCKIPFMIP